MDADFEWDETKSHENLLKHGIRFEEAMTVFDDPLCLLIYDEAHSTDDEDRYLMLGTSDRSRIVNVVHCERDNNRIRIISARKASTIERILYEKGHQKNY